MSWSEAIGNRHSLGKTTILFKNQLQFACELKIRFKIK